MWQVPYHECYGLLDSIFDTRAGSAVVVSCLQNCVLGMQVGLYFASIVVTLRSVLTFNLLADNEKYQGLVFSLCYYIFGILLYYINKYGYITNK